MENGFFFFFIQRRIIKKKSSLIVWKVPFFQVSTEVWSSEAGGNQIFVRRWAFAQCPLGKSHRSVRSWNWFSKGGRSMERELNSNSRGVPAFKFISIVRNSRDFVLGPALLLDLYTHIPLSCLFSPPGDTTPVLSEVTKSALDFPQLRDAKTRNNISKSVWNQ